MPLPEHAPAASPGWEQGGGESGGLTCFEQEGHEGRQRGGYGYGPHPVARHDAGGDHVRSGPGVQQEHGEKAGAQTDQVSDDDVVGSGATELRLLHDFIGGGAEAGED